MADSLHQSVSGMKLRSDESVSIYIYIYRYIYLCIYIYICRDMTFSWRLVRQLRNGEENGKCYRGFNLQVGFGRKGSRYIAPLK